MIENLIQAVDKFGASKSTIYIFLFWVVLYITHEFFHLAEIYVVSEGKKIIFQNTYS